MIPRTPYAAIIQSLQRYYVGAIAETVSKYLALLAVVVWFNTVGPSVKALIVISAVMTSGPMIKTVRTVALVAAVRPSDVPSSSAGNML